MCDKKKKFRSLHIFKNTETKNKNVFGQIDT